MKYAVNLRFADRRRKMAKFAETVVQAVDVESAMNAALAQNQRPGIETSTHGCFQLPVGDESPLGLVPADDLPMEGEPEALKPLTEADFINAATVGRPAEADEIDAPMKRGPGRPRKVA